MKLFAIFTLSATLFTNLFAGVEAKWEDFKQETIEHMLPQIPGWCTKEKASAIMELIRDVRPSACLEIGTFAGSTTLPIARALQFNGHGLLYSVDAWDNYAAVENVDAKDPNYVWLAGYNMRSLQNQCLYWVNQLNLGSICNLIQMRSDELANQLGYYSLDLLYLDGNISSEGSLLDAILFFPKVRYGGYIVMPDGQHPNKKETVSFLMNNARWLPDRSYKTHLLVFRKE